MTTYNLSLSTNVPQHYYLLDTLVFSFGVIGSNKDVLYPAFRHYGLNPANPLSHPAYHRQF